MTNKRARGFTLIELMIVVAIIGILAAIAYPSYRDQIIKSRRAEGKAKLVEMAQALEKCKTLYGVYNDTNCAAYTSIQNPNFVSSENDHFRVSENAAGAVTATAFLLRAVPQQADPTCGTLTLNQAGARGESGTGSVADCW